MNRIQELIKKYHITPYGGNNIRVELIKGAQDTEIEEIKASKSKILKYFCDIEDQKRKEEKEVEQQQKREEKKAQFEKEKRELLSQVDNWKITEHNNSDEGGETKLYKYHFLIAGEKLTFIERNVFDFGVVINPDYEISPGISGGLALKKEGIMQWHTFTRDKGWVPVRPLTNQEQICLEIIKKYGKFSGAGIRM